MPRRRANELDHMDPIAQLGLCVLMDIVGVATYLVPGLGELGDVAP